MNRNWFRIILTNLPLFFVGVVFLFLAFKAEPGERATDGSSLAVLYGVIGGSFIAISSVIALVLVVLTNRKANQIEDIVAHSQKGTARILELNDTGVRINSDPRVTMLLEISIANYQPYRARKTVTVPLINLPQVQPGSVVEIYADPTDPANEKKIGLVMK